MAVRSAMSTPSASWMRLSLSESSELVASSSTRIGEPRNHRAGNADPLACYPRLDATLTDQGVVALREALDELGRVGGFGRLRHLGVVGVQTAEGDVLAQRPVEHQRVLGYVGDLRSPGGYQLVGAFGGSIIVESTVGAAFSIRFPAWD
jgi:hypothetical protein